MRAWQLLPFVSSPWARTVALVWSLLLLPPQLASCRAAFLGWSFFPSNWVASALALLVLSRLPSSSFSFPLVLLLFSNLFSSSSSISYLPGFSSDHTTYCPSLSSSFRVRRVLVRQQIRTQSTLSLDPGEPKQCCCFVIVGQYLPLPSCIAQHHWRKPAFCPALVLCHPTEKGHSNPLHRWGGGRRTCGRCIEVTSSSTTWTAYIVLRQA